MLWLFPICKPRFQYWLDLASSGRKSSRGSSSNSVVVELAKVANIVDRKGMITNTKSFPIGFNLQQGFSENPGHCR